MTMLISGQKKQLRSVMKECRRGVRDRDAKAISVLRLFFEHIRLTPPHIIAVYSPIKDEIDVCPLTDALRAHGHSIALPVVTARGHPLAFRLHRPGDVLISNPMGIDEPTADAPLVDPDIYIVPLLAFDADKNRLGYGGGYYDRTLAEARGRKKILAIGVGYDCQKMKQVPVGPHDQPLDRIVTELNVY